MSDEVQRMRHLHSLLKQKAEVEAHLERGPRLLKQLSAQIDLARKALSDAKEEVLQKKIEADRKQLQLREREGKLLHHQAQLNAAKSNREFQIMKDQIAADHQANSVLSDEILELLEAIDGLGSLVKERATKLNELENELARTEKSVAEKKLALSENRTRLEMDIHDAIEGFLGEVKANLKRLISARGEESLAELNGTSCGGCNTQLTAQVRDRIDMNHAMTCPSCGRLVYKPESLNPFA